MYRDEFLGTYAQRIPKYEINFFSNKFDIIGCNAAYALLEFFGCNTNLSDFNYITFDNQWWESSFCSNEFSDVYYSLKKSNLISFYQDLLILSVELEKKSELPTFLFERILISGTEGANEKVIIIRGYWEMGEDEDTVKLTGQIHLVFNKNGLEKVEFFEQQYILRQVFNYSYCAILDEKILLASPSYDKELYNREIKVDISNVERVIDYLKIKCPEEISGYDQNELAQKVTAGIKRAQRYHINQEQSFMAFIELMFTLSPDFDENDKEVRYILRSNYDRNTWVVEFADKFSKKPSCSNQIKNKASKWEKVLKDTTTNYPHCDILQRNRLNKATSVAISPAENKFAIGFKNGDMYIGTTNSRKIPVKCNIGISNSKKRTHIYPVKKITFSSDGKEVIFISYKEIYIFNVETVILQTIIRGNSFTDAVWIGDNRYAVIDGSQILIHQVDPQGESKIKDLKFEGYSFDEIVFRSESKELLCLDYSKWLIVNVEDYTFRKIDTDFYYLYDVYMHDIPGHFSSNGRCFMKLWGDGIIIDAMTGNYLVYSLPFYPTELSICDERNTIVLCNNYGEIGIYNYEDINFDNKHIKFNELLIEEFTMNPILSVACSHKGNYIAFIDEYGNCGIIKVSTQKIIWGYSATDALPSIEDGFGIKNEWWWGPDFKNVQKSN